jgi:hypothetical protein
MRHTWQHISSSSSSSSSSMTCWQGQQQQQATSLCSRGALVALEQLAQAPLGRQLTVSSSSRVRSYLTVHSLQ